MLYRVTMVLFLPWYFGTNRVGNNLSLTLIFSITNLASDPKKLKKALLSIGAFGVVVLVAFLFSSGTETPLKDGDILSAAGSRWIETGLRTFYFLVFIAVGAMFTLVLFD